jgi:hypothetical protein
VFAKKNRRGGVHRKASMADGGGSAPARGRTGRLYSHAQGGWGRFSCAPREPSRGMGRGMAEVRREGAAATCGVYAGAGWLGGAAPVRWHCGPWVRGTWRQGSGKERRFHGAWTGGSSAASAFGPEGVGRGECRGQP